MAQAQTGRRGRIPAVASVAVGGMVLALLAPATAATAKPPAKPSKPTNTASATPGGACDNRSNNSYDKLLGCMTLEGVLEHMEAFQKIADNSTDPVYPGTRAAGPTATPTAWSTWPACCARPATR
jgi:hypothetical protein